MGFARRSKAVAACRKQMGSRSSHAHVGYCGPQWACGPLLGQLSQAPSGMFQSLGRSRWSARLDKTYVGPVWVSPAGPRCCSPAQSGSAAPRLTLASRGTQPGSGHTQLSRVTARSECGRAGRRPGLVDGGAPHELGSGTGPSSTVGRTSVLTADAQSRLGPINGTRLTERVLDSTVTPGPVRVWTG